MARFVELGAPFSSSHVRAALAKAFPGQKFSVKSKSYAGGASIDVNYEGGPRKADVEAVVAPYCGGDFDGMIDMKYCKYSWIAADGSASRAYDPGTEGSMGVHGEEVGDPHAAGCPYVRFGADFIFVERKATEADYWAAIVAFEKITGMAIRHDFHDKTVSIKTDRKNHRGHWVYEWKREGIAITKLYAFESKSEEPIPYF